MKIWSCWTIGLELPGKPHFQQEQEICMLATNLKITGNPLVVQWLGLCFHCQGVGSFPGQGIKIPQAAWSALPPKKNYLEIMCGQNNSHLCIRFSPWGMTPLQPKIQGFCLNTIDILGQMTLSGEGAIHCRMFSSTPGLYSLDANSIPLLF